MTLQLIDITINDDGTFEYIPDDKIQYSSDTVFYAATDGIETDIVFCFFIWPVPLHFKQGFLIDEPSPPHVGQGRSIEKKPEVDRTFPWPLHDEQILGPDLSALPVDAQLLHPS